METAQNSEHGMGSLLTLLLAALAAFSVASSQSDGNGIYSELYLWLLKCILILAVALVCVFAAGHVV